ncbi:hypothetical protein LB505_001643 [Fusarium chuoi]|nr:hypothetical protein LB505_001643 [Fusarium chuoi]
MGHKKTGSNEKNPPSDGSDPHGDDGQPPQANPEDQEDEDHENRTLFFNQPLPQELLDENGHPTQVFTRNKIRTAKYTPLSFTTDELFSTSNSTMLLSTDYETGTTSMLWRATFPCGVNSRRPTRNSSVLFGEQLNLCGQRRRRRRGRSGRPALRRMMRLGLQLRRTELASPCDSPLHRLSLAVSPSCPPERTFR